FLEVKCTSRHSRLTKMFTGVNGEHFRKSVRFIHEKLEEEGRTLFVQLPFENAPKGIKDLVSRVLPLDDSSLQFSPEGYGITDDLQKTIEQIYERYVEKYHEKGGKHRRTEEDIWKTFKKPLSDRKILERLTPHRIAGKDYEFEFRHCWKNDMWHANQPISFDLMDAEEIADKANRWVGRIMSLADSDEKFRLNVLLGSPQDEKFGGAFIKAQNILNKMPCDHKFVKEDEAEEFAEDLRKEIETHSHN
ncbi:MAG: DUF3037 domain-containing protein, partial [Nitrospirae bacterium]|nr:DUF3037 domain-containing protein [Nitrospirota bacterium]